MTPMQRATEAGARAAQPYAFNDAFWLAKGGPDRHQRHAQDNARRHALDAIRAALPIRAEELIAWHDEQAARLYAEINAIQADGGWVDSHRRSHAEGHTAAASALRARVQSMMEE